MAVVGGGYEECAPNYAVQRSTFPFHVIEWVVGGSGKLNLAGSEIDLRPGMSYCYGPGAPHAIRTNEANPMRKHFVAFMGRSANHACEEAQLLSGTSRMLAHEPRLAFAFEALLRDGSTGKPSSQALCVSLLRYLIQVLAVTPEAPQHGSDQAYETYQRCEALLTEHAAQIASLTQLAEACDVSKSYLCRLYQRFSDISPYQRLLRLRMTAAAELLVDSEAPIGEVAQEMGYVDPFHFSRSFKSVLGVSPSQFRAYQARELAAATRPT